MKRFFFFFLVIITFFLVYNSSNLLLAKRRIALPENITKKLNFVLKEALNLHQALYEQNNDKINLYLKNIRKILNEAQLISLKIKKENINSTSLEIHLKKIIDIIIEKIEYIKSTEEQEKKIVAFQNIFRNFVELIRTYKLNRYKTIYCDKGTIWIQKRRKIINPFYPYNNNHNCKVIFL